jgi:uncharacterized membrane protein YhhN
MINRSGFAAFVLGALLFAGVFWLAATKNMLGWNDESTTDPRLLVALYTIAFGLPYALLELTRRTNFLAILFVLILVPAAHYCAMTAFMAWIGEMQELGNPLVTGAVAGFTGAALSFLALFILGLRASSAGIAVFLAGLLLLAGWGAIGMKLLPEQPESVLDLLVRLYLPWQLIFGFFLSALLRPSPPRGAVATTD